MTQRLFHVGSSPAIRTAIQKAFGKAPTDGPATGLGAGDVTAVPAVSVLPPAVTPLEGNSPALPIVFDILLQNGDCYVRRRGTEELVPLTDVACNPALP